MNVALLEPIHRRLLDAYSRIDLRSLCAKWSAGSQANEVTEEYVAATCQLAAAAEPKEPEPDARAPRRQVSKLRLARLLNVLERLG